MWVADGTRTGIVQLSQISAANAGDYTCQASFIGQSASTSIAVQLNRLRFTPILYHNGLLGGCQLSSAIDADLPRSLLDL